jgi:molybdopterin molybdotransferase
MEMHAFGHLTPLEVARRRLLRAAVPIVRVERIAPDEAFERIAAATLRAPRPVPGFARTNWDGYAIRSGDVAQASRRAPVTLQIVGEVFAEQAYPGRVGPGEAVAIATGGAIPRGADAVVLFEVVEERANAIRVRAPVPGGDRIAPPGHDFPRGALLARNGAELDASALGAIASCGIPRVPVYARPVVTIVPNGNELLVPGAPEVAGKIYESNNATLASVIRAAGAIPRPLPPVRDDARAIEAAVRRALRTSDLVLSTGGSSVGERDLLPTILPRFGPLLFHGLAVRPGKPTLAVRAGSKLVIGMPGHPTSCLINMYWLVLPVLRKIARRPGPGWSETVGTLGGEAAAPSHGLATVVPLTWRNGRWYSTFRGSANITSLARATAFTVLPPGRRVVRAGTRIRVCELVPPLGAGRVDGAPHNG